MRLSAEELHRRGVAESNSARLMRARATLQRALELAEGRDLRARITGSLAYVQSRLGEGDVAEKLCRDALHVPGLSAETRAVLLGQLGAILMHAGRLEAAVAALTAAIAKLGGSAQYGANILTNRAVARMELGRLDESAADLQRAASLFAAAGDPLGEAQARHNLGYVALLSGDLVSAIQEMGAVREVIAEASPGSGAICDVDRAEALREAGDVYEAEEVLARAARTFGAERMPHARAEAELQLARSLLTHDRPAAQRVAASAAARFRRLGVPVWRARAEAVALRAGLATTAPGERIRGRIDAAVAELHRAGFEAEARALRLSLAVARSRASDPPARLPRRRDADPLEVRLLLHEARAARAAARGRPAEARRHAAEGLDELSQWQRSFGSLEMLSSVAMHGAGVLVEGVSASMRSRRPDAVFEWSEHARHFSQQVTPVRPPRDPALAEDLAQLRLLRSELAESDWMADARVRDLRRRIGDRQRTASAGSPGPRRLELDELRAELDGETALLAFVRAADQLACLVVPPRGAGPPLVIDLPWGAVRVRQDGLRAELEAVATTHGGPIAHLVRGALDARLADLSALLVERALATAGDPRRVVITAPGALRGMPWTMLPAMRGRVVTFARSASRWVHERVDPRALRTAGFVVGPGVPRGDEETGTAADAWRDAKKPDDPGAGVSARVLRGDRARTDEVAALAEDVDVLHVVAHGRHAALSPMLSGFELADGTLFGYDIDQIQRPPAVVVLSACELGRSSERWGEEAIGMTRAWVHAGTRCVVSTPVVVADDVACELLGAMHEGLAAHLDPAEALMMAAEETGHVAPFLSHGAGF